MTVFLNPIVWAACGFVLGLITMQIIMYGKYPKKDPEPVVKERKSDCVDRKFDRLTKVHALLDHLEQKSDELDSSVPIVTYDWNGESLYFRFGNHNGTNSAVVIYDRFGYAMAEDLARGISISYMKDNPYRYIYIMDAVGNFKYDGEVEVRRTYYYDDPTPYERSPQNSYIFNILWRLARHYSDEHMLQMISSSSEESQTDGGMTNVNS